MKVSRQAPLATPESRQPWQMAFSTTDYLMLADATRAGIRRLAEPEYAISARRRRVISISRHL